MATESVHVSALIPARPQAVYDAWLSSEQHAKMTGGGAHVEPHVGGAHSAWDDYITGKTVELYPGRRIVQTWRTLEFPGESGDSQIAVTFVEEGGRTRVTIAHTDIPEGQGARYESGWADHYFTPMIAYFSRLASAAAAPPKQAAPRKAAAKTGAAEKGAAKKGAAKKGAAKKAAPKRGAARKAAPKKAAAKKGAARKAAPRKGTAKKAAAKKGAAKKAASRKGTAKKGAAKKGSARKAVVGAPVA